MSTHTGRRRWRRWAIAAGIAVLASSGLAVAYERLPSVRLARHIQRADGHFAARHWRDAVLEYQNVLQLDTKSARAIRNLGLAHYHLGELGHAIRYLRAAAQRDPDDAEVQLKLGNLHVLGRQPALARQAAEAVLAKDPKNLDALVLFAASAGSAAEREAATRRLADERETFAREARYHLALGGLYLQMKDFKSAERAFQDAVAADPRSVQAHAALGDFYMNRKDAESAEREYRAAAALSPVNSLPRLALVDFLLRVNRRDEAKQTLAEITNQAPDFLPAWRRTAELAFAEGRHPDVTTALDRIFKKNPSDFGALMLRGRLRLVRRETSEAIEDFGKVLKQEPRFAGARFHLALAYLQAGNVQFARTELRQTTELAPHFVEAVLQLAELDIRMRAPQAAVEALERLIVKHPTEARAHALLGSAYLGKKEPVKAIDSYRRFIALAPKDPRGPFLLGRALRSQGQAAAAKKEFEAALAMAPDYVDPLVELAGMAQAEKRRDLAIERVRKQIGLATKSAPMRNLLAMIYLSGNEVDLAEAELLKSIELQPAFVGGYVTLGQLYTRTGRFDQALKRFEAASKLDPTNVVPHMLTGVIHEHRKDIPRARDAYERVIAINSRFAPAANNLAYIYSEHGGDKERALQLAQMAKELAPDDPRVSDTLGWILYKRGVYHRAHGLLKESVAKLPDLPEIQYHFGMASVRTGDIQTAKIALRAAVESKSDFPGKEEARKTLAELK